MRIVTRVFCFAIFAAVPGFGQENSGLSEQLADRASAAVDTAAVDVPASDGPASDATADDAVPEGHSQHGEAFNEGPRQHAYLMGGTGVIHFPVTTSHPRVQAFVEQGIGQLHGFWYFEAERSFRQAAMFDPDCAIAYWGMAMANTNNEKRARGFIAEAVKRKDHASPREAMYVDALNDRLISDDKEKTRGKKYVSAMRAIVEEFPDDVEAKGLLGNALYMYREDVGLSHEEADAELKKVLSLQPLHPVHHYLIHLWDREKPSNALESSALCGPSSPAIAHMWHMPGHIYWGLKRYRDSAWQQEASARVDHAHMMRDRVMPDQIHNFAHNNEWLIRSLINIGRFRDALDLAKNMIELPRHPKYNVIGKSGSAYYGRIRLLDVLSGFELWDELIQLADGPYLAPTDSEVEQVRRLRHLGVAYARRGDRTLAEATLAELEQRLDAGVVTPQADESREDAVEEDNSQQGPPQGKPRDDSSKDASEQQDKPTDDVTRRRRRQDNGPRRNVERAIAAIRGHLAAADGDDQTALSMLKKADEDELTIARIQCLAGEVDKAVEAAERHVRANENQVLPLARYVDILWLAGKKDEAAKAFGQLRELSAEIQFGSPPFDRLAPVAKELGLPADWRVNRPPPDDVGQRPPLDSLGPFRWQPMPAPDWVLKDYQGTPYSLSQYRGRPVIVIFYLGYGCLHCAQQLQAFAPMTEKFHQAGISLIAVSTDDRKGLRVSLENYEGGMPFPLVANAEMDVFKAYRAYDDFEDMPLHGTFLVDAGGLVRWQDISYEPFMDVDFVLDESRRLLSSPSL